MKFDEYEKELLKLEEEGLIKAKKPNAQEKKALMEAARASLQKDRRINIRLSNRDLVSLKRKANRAGMPYQTLIASILHRYASGNVKVEPAAGGNATR